MAAGERLPLKARFPEASPLVLGCMGMGGHWSAVEIDDAARRQAHAALDAALEAGIRVFDHADIYKQGRAEAVFGTLLAERPGLRDGIWLQSKCAIRLPTESLPTRYDWSPDWIRQSVEGSLRRLQTDYLDALLLHRPDPLAEMEEVAACLEELRAAGKVRNFGVSNMNWYQMQLLQRHLQQPLVCNQLEMSLSQVEWIREGVLVGHPTAAGSHFAPGTLEYCAAHDVQVQAWGCLSQGRYSGMPVEDLDPVDRRVAEVVAHMARAYTVSPEAIVLAWLMRHPQGIQPVLGTLAPERIRNCAQACRISLDRDSWYQLTEAALGHQLP